jgi:hypothetical protein
MSICLTHPSEPITATFALVTLSAGGDQIACKILSTIGFSFNVIECKFINFIVVSAINALTIEVLFDCSSPELLSV